MALKDDQKKELRNLILADPAASLKTIRDRCSFKVSHVTVKNHKAILKVEIANLIPYQNGEKAKELTESLRLNLEVDLGGLREIAWGRIGGAMKELEKGGKGVDRDMAVAKAEDELLTWFREATRTADTTARHLKAFDLHVDASTNTTTINTGDYMRAYDDDLCGLPSCKCCTKIMARRAQQARDVR